MRWNRLWACLAAGTLSLSAAGVSAQSPAVPAAETPGLLSKEEINRIADDYARAAKESGGYTGLTPGQPAEQSNPWLGTAVPGRLRWEDAGLGLDGAQKRSTIHFGGWIQVDAVRFLR
jgi:hypothetical protein